MRRCCHPRGVHSTQYEVNALTAACSCQVEATLVVTCEVWLTAEACVIIS